MGMAAEANKATIATQMMSSTRVRPDSGLRNWGPGDCPIGSAPHVRELEPFGGLKAGSFGKLKVGRGAHGLVQSVT
jgi:hypothetical protein